MRNILVVVVLVAAGALLWNLQHRGDEGTPGQHQTTTVLSAEAGASASATASGGSASDAISRADSASGSVASQPGAPALTGKAIAELGMTRQLAGDHLVQMDGRLHRVLGSKEVADQAGISETMLLIRDETSGQISYRLSGLQFALKDGVDYDAFIREHGAMRRLFVNPMYAQVAVDAALIAEQYAALANDSRVTKLRFMTREPVVKPR